MPPPQPQPQTAASEASDVAEAAEAPAAQAAGLQAEAEEPTDSATGRGAAALKQIEAQAYEAATWWFEEDLKYSVDASSGGRMPPSDATTTNGSLIDAESRCSFAACPQAQGLGLAQDKGGGSGEGPAKAKLLKCGRCGASFCSQACLRSAWRLCHKRECPLLAAWQTRSLGRDATRGIVEWTLRRVRMYMSPFCIGFTDIRGRGAVLCRSNATLGDWIFEQSVGARGEPLRRSVRLQFLTLDEFDGLAFEDDFEMALVHSQLEEALAAYDKDTEVVALVILRCGYFACVTLPLVPDLHMSRSLAAHYAYTKQPGPLELVVDSHE